MDAEQCKQAVMSAWKAFGSGDAARIEAHLAPDAGWRAPPGKAPAVAMNYTHHMIGRASIVDSRRGHACACG